MNYTDLVNLIKNALKNFPQYKGKTPPLGYLRALQKTYATDYDSLIPDLKRYFPEITDFNGSGPSELRKIVPILLKQNLNANGIKELKSKAGAGGASLSGLSKSKPAPKLNQPVKSKPPPKGKASINKPAPKMKIQPKSSGAGAGAGAPSPSPPPVKAKKPRKPMTQAHKDKIKSGIQKYHANCKKAMAMMNNKNK